MPKRIENEQIIRLDRWLWVARFAKSRTRAAELCTGNKVKVNRIPGKPSKDVRVGDILSMNINGEYRKFEVLGIRQRPIPAKEARELYIETTPVRKPREVDELMKIARQMERQSPPSKGRPTKKERRVLEKVKGFGK